MNRKLSQHCVGIYPAVQKSKLYISDTGKGGVACYVTCRGILRRIAHRVHSPFSLIAGGKQEIKM